MVRYITTPITGTTKSRIVVGLGGVARDDGGAARTPEGRRIPQRVLQGYDVIVSGKTIRAESVSIKELQEYYKRTGITPPPSVRTRITTEEYLVSQQKKFEDLQRARAAQRVAYRAGEPSIARRDIQLRETKRSLERQLKRDLTKEEEKTFLQRVKRKPDETYIQWSRRTQQEVRDWRYRTLEKVEEKLQEFVTKRIIKPEEVPFIKRIPRKPDETYLEWVRRSQKEFKKLGRMALGTGLMLYPSIVTTVAKVEAKPEKAIREELVRLKEIPTAFRERPVETAVSIAATLATAYLTGIGIKEYRIKKLPKIKVQVSKKVITEYDPIKKGVKYYREQALVKVYEKVKNKWTLKETLTPEAFYETYGIKEIGIGPIIKKKAEVTFRTKTGQAITETFSKDLLSIIERTALGKKPTLAVGGIIIKRGGRIYTGDLLGVSRRVGRRETFGLADIAMGGDRISGIGISRRLIKLVKDKKVLEIGREVGIAKGPRVRDVFFGEYVFKPLVERPRVPVTFIAPSKLALERIAKLKFFVPAKVIEKVVKEIVTPKVKYPKGILFGATAGIIKPVAAPTFFPTEEIRESIWMASEFTPTGEIRKPKVVYAPEEAIYKPREEFMMGIGTGQIEGIKQQIKQTTSAIQQEKQALKQIPKEAVMMKQAAQQRLATLTRQATLQRQAQKQAQKQLQKLKQVQAQVTTPMMITTGITTGIPFPFITPKPSPLLISALKKLKKKVPGFITLVKEKGIWKPISKKPLPRYKAIQLGETFVGKLSLAAQFKILPKGIVFGIEKPYEPSPIEFRPYKIRKKVKVPLEDRWIERAEWRLEKGMKSRETALIQRAKTSYFKTSTKKKKKKKVSSLWWS